jgi:putative flippase GtrA
MKRPLYYVAKVVTFLPRFFMLALISVAGVLTIMSLLVMLFGSPLEFIKFIGMVVGIALVFVVMLLIYWWAEDYQEGGDTEKP